MAIYTYLGSNIDKYNVSPSGSENFPTKSLTYDIGNVMMSDGLGTLKHVLGVYETDDNGKMYKIWPNHDPYRFGIVGAIEDNHRGVTSSNNSDDDEGHELWIRQSGVKISVSDLYPNVQSSEYHFYTDACKKNITFFIRSCDYRYSTRFPFGFKQGIENIYYKKRDQAKGSSYRGWISNPTIVAKTTSNIEVDRYLNSGLSDRMTDGSIQFTISANAYEYNSSNIDLKDNGNRIGLICLEQWIDDQNNSTKDTDHYVQNPYTGHVINIFIHQDRNKFLRDTIVYNKVEWYMKYNNTYRKMTNNQTYPDVVSDGGDIIVYFVILGVGNTIGGDINRELFFGQWDYLQEKPEHIQVLASPIGDPDANYNETVNWIKNNDPNIKNWIDNVQDISWVNTKELPGLLRATLKINHNKPSIDDKGTCSVWGNNTENPIDVPNPMIEIAPDKKIRSEYFTIWKESTTDPRKSELWIKVNHCNSKGKIPNTEDHKVSTIQKNRKAFIVQLGDRRVDNISNKYSEGATISYVSTSPNYSYVKNAAIEIEETNNRYKFTVEFYNYNIKENRYYIDEFKAASTLIDWDGSNTCSFKLMKCKDRSPEIVVPFDVSFTNDRYQSNAPITDTWYVKHQEHKGNDPESIEWEDRYGNITNTTQGIGATPGTVSWSGEKNSFQVDVDPNSPARDGNKKFKNFGPYVYNSSDDSFTYINNLDSELLSIDGEDPSSKYYIGFDYGFGLTDSNERTIYITITLRSLNHRLEDESRTCSFNQSGCQVTEGNGDFEHASSESFELKNDQDNKTTSQVREKDNFYYIPVTYLKNEDNVEGSANPTYYIDDNDDSFSMTSNNADKVNEMTFKIISKISNDTLQRNITFYIIKDSENAYVGFTWPQAGATGTSSTKSDLAAIPENFNKVHIVLEESSSEYTLDVGGNPETNLFSVRYSPKHDIFNAKWEEFKGQILNGEWSDNPSWTIPKDGDSNPIILKAKYVEGIDDQAELNKTSKFKIKYGEDDIYSSDNVVTIFYDGPTVKYGFYPNMEWHSDYLEFVSKGSVDGDNNITQSEWKPVSKNLTTNERNFTTYASYGGATLTFDITQEAGEPSDYTFYITNNGGHSSYRATKTEVGLSTFNIGINNKGPQGTPLEIECSSKTSSNKDIIDIDEVRINYASSWSSITIGVPARTKKNDGSKVTLSFTFKQAESQNSVSVEIIVPPFEAYISIEPVTA